METAIAARKARPRSIARAPRGAFAAHFREAHDVGLVTVPTCAANAKRPLWKNWNRRKKPAQISTVERFLQHAPDSNWGLLPGPSGLVILDLDDESELSWAVETFGPSPFVVATGRGMHLYYKRTAAITSVNLRYALGRPIDVIANGLVVGWGSQHSSGAQYSIIKGSVDDLLRLPHFDASRLQELIGYSPDEEPELRSPCTENSEGTRNAATFAAIRAEAAAGLFATLGDVCTATREFNQRSNVPPLPTPEVDKIARNVFRYLEKGTCKPPRQRTRRGPTAAEISRLRDLDVRKYDYADALALLVELRSAHGARARRGESFAIAAKAMAEAGIIPGWRDRKRYLRAKNALCSVGIIELANGCELQKWETADGRRHARGLRAAQYVFGRVA